MKPSLEKIQKFFKHETDLGYEDRAVMGGLEKIISPWEDEARGDGLPEELIQAVCGRLQDYRRLSPASRRDVLLGLQRRIQRFIDGESLPPAEISPPITDTGQHKEITQKSAPKAFSPMPRVVSRDQTVGLDAPVTVLSGVGQAVAKILAHLGIHTLGDMLYYLPRRYDDYSALKPIHQVFYGEEVTVIATVIDINTRTSKSGKKITEAVISDGSGSLRVTWFNQPWRASQLRKGTQVVLAGKVDQYMGRLVMNSPECDLLEHKHLNTNRIVPVYPLSANIKQRRLRSLMDEVVNHWSARVADPIPQEVLQNAGLIDLNNALLHVHFPESWEALAAARKRLAFDEIFFIQLGVLSQKKAWNERSATVFQVDDEWLTKQTEKLPFKLTNAQSRVLEEIRADLSSGRPMNRLLQGDVGSGKTVLAGLGMCIVAQSGGQSAMLAPTSILAEQHYRTLQRLFATDEINDGCIAPDAIRLLVGATPEAEKEEIRAGLADGRIKILIGTHALLEDPVQFANLQLAVIDEQHRFGVEQRAILRNKGENPHLLVMTATPIPRSLALTIYGDLDLSVMDEVPPGRQEVDTHVLYPSERNRAYTLIQKQLNEGRQVFIIYPLVEESENLDVKAAVDEYERLQEDTFKNHKVGLLHGRMKPDEKDEVMAQFHNGEFEILVSTSVVEVGVDVPNATVMLIEGANRFGLAQLHQFRGRVGRGTEKSYCILIPSNTDEKENERLRAMTETNNGFILAERDLEQRGPGDFLGTRQSGYAELRAANLGDVHLIELARNQAQALFEKDPDLKMADHQPLVNALQKFWSPARAGDIS